MKFEFELDSIDVADLHSMFMREQHRILKRMLEAERGKLDYIVNIPAYIRGCFNELRQLDRLVNVINPRYEFDSSHLIALLVDRYGENIYDADGNYTGHTLETEG